MPEFDVEKWFEDNLEDVNGEQYWRVMSRFDFHKTVKAMGWETVSEFINETGVEFDDIDGCRWMVCGYPARVFTA